MTGRPAHVGTRAGSDRPKQKIYLKAPRPTRAPVPPIRSWRAGAACVGMDTNAFFHPDTNQGKPAKLGREERAKAVCACCPVIAQCRDWALASRQEWGVWGGTTERERRELWMSSYQKALAGRLPGEALDGADRTRLLTTLLRRGWTDGHIAEHTRWTTYTVARMRNALGLEPNTKKGAAA